jgi:hypothetical protein
MSRPLPFVIVALALILTAPLVVHAGGVTAPQVETAINKAKVFLYAQQKEGNWEIVQKKAGNEGNADLDKAQWGGLTSIVAYALLAAGDDAQANPKLAQAVKFLRAADINGTYALAMRMQVWLLLPRTHENSQAMHRDALFLVNAVKTQGTAKGYYNYWKDEEGGRFDRSVSQYGVLGMWAAAQMNVEVPTPYWRFVEEAWRRDQRKDGGWDYDGNQLPTPAMTAAGLATLFITQDMVHGQEGIGCKGNFKDPHLDAALNWMTQHNKEYYNAWPFYTLYGVERVGVASGYRYFGTFDWYREGAAWLLTQQQADGGFGGNGPERIYNTCFATLFLVRGRAPVMMNKLEYSIEPPGYNPAANAQAARNAPPAQLANWNNRPRDAANLAHWMSGRLERYINWQVVNTRTDPDDWLDAPILYIAGNQVFNPRPEDAAKIKHYIESGGLVLGNADCSNGAFANSFQHFGERLFPGEKFRDLPADHLIYTQPYSSKNWRIRPPVKALSNGARELMVLLPAGDPAKLWQVQSFMGTSQGAAEVAANTFLYTVSKTELRHKDETYLVKADPNIKAERTVKVARLMYEGKDCIPDPEPGGWRRLAAVSHNSFKTDLDVVPVTLGQGKLTGEFKVAHLTGTKRLEISPKGIAELKKWVNEGGTLIVDAAGGNYDFAQAAESQLAAMFPPAKPPFPLLRVEHPVYTALGGPTPIEYRAFARRTLSNSNGPRLRGLEVNNRAAVFFSGEDLSCGLVGSSTDGIHGYMPSTATGLMLDMIYFGAGVKPPPPPPPSTKPAAPAPK